MSTTFSSRSCRYSTSVTSSSSVERPPTRRSAARSSRSNCSPSVSAVAASSEPRLMSASAAPTPNRVMPALDSAPRSTRSTASSVVGCSASFIVLTLVPIAAIGSPVWAPITISPRPRGASGVPAPSGRCSPAATSSSRPPAGCSVLSTSTRALACCSTPCRRRPGRATCWTSAPVGDRSRSAWRCSRRMPRCGPST